MPVVVLFLIFVALLVIAVPVSITLGITSVLPSVFDPSFTVGAKYLIRAMFGGLDSFPRSQTASSFSSEQAVSEATSSVACSMRSCASSKREVLPNIPKITI